MASPKFSATSTAKEQTKKDSPPRFCPGGNLLSKLHRLQWWSPKRILLEFRDLFLGGRVPLAKYRSHVWPCVHLGTPIKVSKGISGPGVALLDALDCC